MLWEYGKIVAPECLRFQERLFKRSFALFVSKVTAEHSPSGEAVRVWSVVLPELRKRTLRLKKIYPQEKPGLLA